MPVIVLGPALTKVSGPEAVEQGTNTHIYNFFNGTSKSVKGTEFMFYDEVSHFLAILGDGCICFLENMLTNGIID
jgi:hypothetical protein